MGDITGINSFFRALPVDYLALPEGDRQNRNGAKVADAQAAGQELADEVELSDLGKRLARMAETPNVRLGRIAKIRAAVVAGTYETPSKIATTADRLLEKLKG